MQIVRKGNCSECFFLQLNLSFLAPVLPPPPSSPLNMPKKNYFSLITTIVHERPSKSLKKKGRLLKLHDLLYWVKTEYFVM